MKFTFSWLKEYLETEATLEELLKKIDDIGIEVEGVEDPAEPLKGFVVGEVLEATKHPDSDHLQCLIVNDGKQHLKVVCGAPNARKGLRGIFAPAGSYIPGIDVVLKKANIRGQESNGMMCSEKELCISDEHKGIIELQGNFKAGDDAAKALGFTDVVIEVKILPDMGDLASVYGIARDLSATGIGKLKPLPNNKVKVAFKSPVGVEIKDSKACDIFVGRYVKGVKNGESPKWMQERLKAAGQKPISALVDITNYMTLAYGRPLHVFDADKLKGNIHARFAKDGEEVAALNDNTYKLDNTIPVICDDSGALGMAGVMGGTSSAADENTTNVFIECAYFNPTMICLAGQKLRVSSDASYRFERGIDASFVEQGAEMAAQMVLDICGGQASEPVVAGTAPDVTKHVNFRPDRLKTLCGVDAPEAEQKRILEALGFTVKAEGKLWDVKTPSWRHDITVGEADLVEEVLRIYGFDHIPLDYVRQEKGDAYPELSPLQERMKKARRALCNNGLYEAVTWSFMDEKKAFMFGAKDNPKRDSVRIPKPIASDLGYMRPSILPNLIDAAGNGFDRGVPDSALFEVGRIFLSPAYEDQKVVVAGIRSGNIEPRHWAHGSRKADVIDAKTDVVAVFDALGVNIDSLQISTDDIPSYYHPARSGAFKMGKFVIAYFGEIHPGILAKMGRSENYAAFEIFMDAIPESKKKSAAKPLLKISNLQPLVRDFAFLMERSVSADKIVKLVKKVEPKLISAVEIFDVYMGKGIDENMKSIAFAVTIQPTEKTLTDEEIAKLSQTIIAEVEKQTGGKLRT